jgi:hypothetical protein
MLDAMRKTFILAATLLLGGYLSDNGPPPDARAERAANKAARYDDSDKKRQMCVDTTEGGVGKTVCY